MEKIESKYAKVSRSRAAEFYREFHGLSAVDENSQIEIDCMVAYAEKEVHRAVKLVELAQQAKPA